MEATEAQPETQPESRASCCSNAWRIARGTVKMAANFCNVAGLACTYAGACTANPVLVAVGGGLTIAGTAISSGVSAIQAYQEGGKFQLGANLTAGVGGVATSIVGLATGSEGVTLAGGLLTGTGLPDAVDSLRKTIGCAKDRVETKAHEVDGYKPTEADLEAQTEANAATKPESSSVYVDLAKIGGTALNVAGQVCSFTGHTLAGGILSAGGNLLSGGASIYSNYDAEKRPTSSKIEAGINTALTLGGVALSVTGAIKDNQAFALAGSLPSTGVTDGVHGIVRGLAGGTGTRAAEHTLDVLANKRKNIEPLQEMDTFGAASEGMGKQPALTSTPKIPSST